MRKRSVSIIAFVLVFICLLSPLTPAVRVSAATYKKGSSGSAVAAIHEKLITLGYMKSHTSNKFDSATVKAVKAFQKASKLSQTGTVNSTTQTKLTSAYNTKIKYSGTAKTVTVKNSTANLRSGPGTRYSKLSTAKKSTKFTVTGIAKATNGTTWYRFTKSGRSMWICSAQVTVSTASSTATTAKTTVKTTTTKATTKATSAVKTGTVTITVSVSNLRKGAGTSYGVYTTAKKGKKFDVYGSTKVSGTTWYKIKYNTSTYLWVSGTCVSYSAATTKTTTTTKATTTTKSTTTTKTTTTTKATTTTTVPPAPKDEMRAVWVPYMTLSKVTKEKIDSIVANAEKHHFNAIILHVRPYGDALYKSDIFPASHFVTGTQGKALPFDVLGYTIEKAHAKNIEVHAWINPLRIQKGSVPSSLAKTNPAYIWLNDDDKSNDRRVISYDGGKYYNPAIPEVRQLIVDGMTEIVEKYDVDGIHWDDYFYPASGTSFDDSKEYNAYKNAGGTKSLLAWRKENINALVRESYKAVKEINSSVVFGISPGGNYDNARNAGADIDTWGKSDGYVDYLCPQLYWSFDYGTASFDKRCRYWRKLVTNPNIKFYVGLPLYKAGSDDDNGTWKDSDDIIARQVLFSRTSEIHADGFMMYSYDYLNKSQSKKEVANFDKLFS